MTERADFIPPRWLRSRHLQSVLSSSGLRRRGGARALTRLGARHDEHLLDAGKGVRLLGIHSHLPRPARALVVLLHGWEGSAQSGYMLHTAATLLAAGFDVFRLNFRDHGDTHHLNLDPFHSCRIDEVVNATRSLTQIVPTPRLLAAGFSLGGNFALRLALRAPAAGIALRQVAAVCPVIDPAAGLRALETSLPLYHWYFMRKWRDSLRRKRALFPHRHDFDEAVLAQNMRALTAWMVDRYTDMGALETYLDGYSVAGERLAASEVPVNILAASDDPVIPIADFHRLRLPAHSRLEIAAFGGHCGFLEGMRLHGFAERWVCQRLLTATE